MDKASDRILVFKVKINGVDFDTVFDSIDGLLDDLRDELQTAVREIDRWGTLDGYHIQREIVVDYMPRDEWDALPEA
jgi:hypothetical protein